MSSMEAYMSPFCRISCRRHASLAGQLPSRTLAPPLYHALLWIVRAISRLSLGGRSLFKATASSVAPSNKRGFLRLDRALLPPLSPSTTTLRPFVNGWLANQT